MPTSTAPSHLSSLCLVFVNNQKILESEVRSGDFLSIGNTVFKFFEHLLELLSIFCDVDALCSRFDATVAKEATLFGSPSDVNNDGKIELIFGISDISRISDIPI